MRRAEIQIGNKLSRLYTTTLPDDDTPPTTAYEIALLANTSFTMKTPIHHVLAALVLSVLGLVALSGCANSKFVRVQPWERSTLADYTMRPDRDPLASTMAEHVYFSRESASGGRGIGGSGCGCN